MTTPKDKKPKRKAPLLKNGREEFFMPDWLTTGAFNTFRAEEPADPKPAPKKDK